MKQVSYIKEMNDRAIQHQSRNITTTTANSTMANTGKHYSTIFFQNYNSMNNYIIQIISSFERKF